MDFESETFVVAPTLDASFGRLQGCSGQDANHGHGHLVSVTYSIMPMNSGTDYKARETDIAQPLMAGGPVGGNQGGDYIAQPIAFPERMSATQYGATEDLSPTIAALNPTAIAFSCKEHGADASDDLSPTLRAMGHADSHANAGGQMAMAIQAGALRENPNSGPDGIGVQSELAYTIEARAEVQAVAFDLRGREGGAEFEGPHDTANIRAASGSSSRSYVAEQWAVRRLTVRECERLQGYPDGWTLIEFGSRRTVEQDEADYLAAQGAHIVTDNRGRLRTNAAADGPRYKGLGNAWAVACVRPVALRILSSLPNTSHAAEVGL